MRDEPPFLLYVADGAAQLYRVQRMDVIPSHAHFAAIGGDHSVEQAQQRGFPCAALTDKGDDLSSFDG